MRKILFLLTIIAGQAATAAAQQPTLTAERASDDSQTPVTADQQAPSNRPRVALVLSSSGAKGMGHIGSAASHAKNYDINYRMGDELNEE